MHMSNNINIIMLTIQIDLFCLCVCAKIWYGKNSVAPCWASSNWRW